MIFKIPVAVLGATGLVGQKFVELLSKHPYFEIKALAASEKSEGKSYGQAVSWHMSSPLPEKIKALPLLPCQPSYMPRIVFSALKADCARPIEEAFARKGHFVFSNARVFRMDKEVPLLIPEINASHLHLLHKQPWEGSIVTNSNCVVSGLAPVLKPFLDFGLEKGHIVTLQSVSGAGLQGPSAFSMLGNIIPHIEGESGKIIRESEKILGDLENPLPLNLTCQCLRVPTLEGHMATVHLQLKNPFSFPHWHENLERIPNLPLPTAPLKTVVYLEDSFGPQIKKNLTLHKGMSIWIGNLQIHSPLEVSFVFLVHNLMRGAAGGSLLNAELFLHNFKKHFQEKKALASL